MKQIFDWILWSFIKYHKYTILLNFDVCYRYHRSLLMILLDADKLFGLNEKNKIKLSIFTLIWNKEIICLLPFVSWT
jgi:hypothetical protein